MPLKKEKKKKKTVTRQLLFGLFDWFLFLHNAGLCLPSGVAIFNQVQNSNVRCLLKVFTGQALRNMWQRSREELRGVIKEALNTGRTRQKGRPLCVLPNLHSSKPLKYMRSFWHSNPALFIWHFSQFSCIYSIQTQCTEKEGREKVLRLSQNTIYIHQRFYSECRESQDLHSLTGVI